MVISGKNLTLGLPVVPLEKLKNATFFLASPGLSRLSEKRGMSLSPLFANSSMLECGEIDLSATLNNMTSSGGMPTVLAALSAVDRKSGCTNNKRDFVVVSWWTSSSAE
jgi:hypothetical protein